MTAKTPVYQLEYLVVGEPARNTRAALENNAKSIEAALIAGGVAPPGAQDLLQLSGRVTALEGAAWSTYNVLWTAAGGAPVVGNGSLVGRYRKVGRTVDIRISLVFGSTTGGGTGEWLFSLPSPGLLGVEQVLNVKGYSGAGDMVGVALLGGGAADTAAPMLPTSAATSALGRVRNSITPAVQGSGVPYVANQFSFLTNHNLTIHGRYESQS